MPEMYDIYNKYSLEYDQLTSFEDYEQNLRPSLLSRTDFKGKKVIEAGAGTGRVTAL